MGYEWYGLYDTPYRWRMSFEQIKEIVFDKYEIGKEYIVPYKFPWSDVIQFYKTRLIQKTKYMAVFRELKTGLVACLRWEQVPSADLDYIRSLYKGG